MKDKFLNKGGRKLSIVTLGFSIDATGRNKTIKITSDLLLKKFTLYSEKYIKIKKKLAHQKINCTYVLYEGWKFNDKLHVISSAFDPHKVQVRDKVT